ncbi:ABC transporter ATP-binding protein [Streptomyces monashensis]|uniref:ABC transporter n=1 Tax=Streptomyces monashensis TaxID=1678012 RepID=A0A1S2Q0B0_9ACTN|nr:ABC transporter ATP-binding protein [Streptomyces monashensis]OIJ99045.1 ABC transporter [Streptomyces monashensis]
MTTSHAASQQVRIGADLLRQNRLQLGAALLLALVATAGTLAVPLLVKDIISTFGQNETITRPVILMAAAALGSAAAAAASSYLLSRIGEFMVLRLRQRVMEHSLRLPMSTVRAQGAGNLVARVTSDAMLLRAVIDIGVVQLPLAALTVVFTLVVMAVLDWLLVLITVGSFALAGAAIGWVLIRVRRNIVEQQDAVGELAQRFTAYLAALPTIKAFRSEGRSASRLGESAQQLTGTSLVGARLQMWITPVMQLGQQVALVGVIIGGGARIASGDLSVPSFAAFLLYLLQLVSPVTVVATGIGRLQAGLAARTRFNEFFDLAQETAGAQPGLSAPQPRPGTAAVTFEDVSFSYTGVPVLDRVTFTAPRTGLTALVGPSGAGKSTCLTLIDRFMHPDDGKINILGHAITDWPLEELRSRVAYVDQQFTLLEGTVRDNLQLGRAEPASEEELATALEAVGLLQDLTSLPDGLDTTLGRENDLSGGQRQRLALARALLTDADIVLLDEPTSQMDSINEKRFRQVVDDLATTRAVMVVAHRLSTVQHADHVVMLTNGTLTDAGTHQTLMDRCSPYRDLVNSQQMQAA